jgi:hypothetical protein
MLRFPNPGSTTANFVAVYRAAFERLHGRIVNLDDIVAATVDANLATSSGYMGSEAISRSTRPDRSRDPLYNQLKMYAELFRILGWLHPTERTALNYTFTLLGRQVVAAEQHYLPLLGETALGIAYPSHVLSVRGDHHLRPFALILRTMLACDDALSRDEMIVGPLSASSDRDAQSVARMTHIVAAVRANPQAVEDALERVSDERSIQTNTLKNYTRWPIAILRDCGWTEKVRMKFRKGTRSFEIHRLTDAGKAVAQWVAASIDLRVDQVDPLPPDEQAAICTYAHYSMLERAGFDLAPVRRKLDLQLPALKSAHRRLGVEVGRPLLFSPFQSMAIAEIRRIFPSPEEAAYPPERDATAAGAAIGRGSRDHLFVEPRLIRQEHGSDDGDVKALESALAAISTEHASEKDAARAFAVAHATDTRQQFYPLVSKLFQVLGFSSDYSRLGVNYQRWDAWVSLDTVAIPIEIKSPTEEAFLSTKAIRQALENKIILLARGGLTTNRDISSLIVGYQLPNERGDMGSLIDDIYGAFKIRIGVIDLATLALLAIRAVADKVTIDPDQLGTLRGFLRV